MIILLLLVIALVLGLSLAGVEGATPFLRFFVRNPIFFSDAGWVIFAALLLAIAGLLALKRWGWILTMALTGMGLSFGIWSYLQDDPHYIALIINIVIVFYLNQREVQAPFMPRNPARSVA
jgi:hypothetical protein